MTAKELKYPPEFKKEVCEYAQKENIKSAAAVYGVHYNTITRWLKKYRLKGLKGFITKRTDTQETKLDDKTLKSIIRYKKKHPKVTLKEIKEKYGLDCHITLISRKLRKVSVSQRTKKESVLLKLRLVKRTLLKGDEITVYRLSIHSCDGKMLSIGFTDSYYSENICFFIRYSFEKLKMLKKFKNLKTIYSSIKFIKSRDYDNIVKSSFNVELKYPDNNSTVCTKGDIDHSGSDIELSIEESFEKILENYSGTKFQNILLTSIVDIRKLSGNQPGIFQWNELPMPSETKKSLYSVLSRIKSKGDRAVMEFDFATAKKEYDKAYSVITSLAITDKMLLNSILLEKAKLFYNEENYHSALMLFRDCMKVSKKNGAVKELADSYYFIGLIHKYFQNTKGAVKYFILSSKILEAENDAISVCMHYRAKYRRYLSEEKYKKAEKYSRLYHESALKTDDSKLIGNCLSTRGAYLYRTFKYEEYEATLIEAKEYNIIYDNLHDACNNITNLLSLYCHSIVKEIEIIDPILEDLKFFASKRNLHFLVYESLFRLGIYYYHNSNFKDAEKRLSESLPGVKKFLETESYLSNLYYLGRIYFDRENYTKAVRYLLNLAREAKRNDHRIYMFHSYRLLIKIYMIKKDYKRTVSLLNKAIILAKQLEITYASGEFYDYYGDICRIKNMKKKSLYNYTQSLKYFKDYSNRNNYDLSEKTAKIYSKIECCK